jgi:site-specific DNA-methyltransferase (adenine-specific)
MSKSTPKKPNTPTQLEWAPIESVTPYARNPRKIGADAISAVAGSIKEFGFKSPIIVDKDRVIINGHTRLKAAQQLGLKEVPIVVASDLTPEQVRAYRIADNRSAEFSKWDEDFLKVELDDIGDIDLSFCNVDEMLAELEEQSKQEQQEQMTEGDPDEVPAEAQGEPVSQRGEVFELGPHRLMCGDSTSAEDWHSLLGGEVGDAVMTDPPYGVDMKSVNASLAKVGKASKTRTDESQGIDGDHAAGLPALLDGALGCMFDRCKAGGAWYVAAQAGPLFLHFANWMHGREILRQMLIWNKDSMVLGHGDYHYKHEPIFYGWKPGAPHRATPDRTQVSVWEVARPKRSAEHPTMKPVELYERMMNNSTAPGEMILEPFGGSGTTLIAAAKTGRVCRAMEIAPRYCDVIRRRWTKFAKENNVEPGTGALE